MNAPADGPVTPRSRPVPAPPSPRGLDRSADRPAAAPACDPSTGCVTCADEGVPMRVLRVHSADLAECAGASGEPVDVLTGVVGDVVPGDTLLVHAGTALLLLDRSRDVP